MKAKFYITSIFILLTFVTKSQVLNVPEVTQEQDQWCWVGTSKCILDYYDFSISQCQIAEYTRTVATWHDFGNVNCCNTPGGECNYWNYNWGSDGSIEDILEHFGDIQNYGYSSFLTTSKSTEEISANRPFVIRWGWTSGGGHFIIGHGIENNSTFYYMDPWFGEGLKISTYEWVKSNSSHNWTHTNILTTSPSTAIETDFTDNSIKIYPNPTNGIFTIEINPIDFEQIIEITDLSGHTILTSKLNENQEYINLDLSQFSEGIYIVNIKSNGINYFNKLIKI
jgi:hypothetical protein